MEIANQGIVMNLKSLTGVNDGIKDGDIPDWLIVELLIRLPQKLVFRFKLVSKQWLSIISDPSFVKIYCSLQKLQPWTFISSVRYFNPNKRMYIPDCKLLMDIYSSNYKWPDFYALSLSYFQHLRIKGYRIYEVSNGFVLYGPYDLTQEGLWDSANYRICNPATGQWIALPPHLNRKTGVSWGFATNVEDGVLVSYTVVRLDVFDSSQSKFVRFEVFLSDIGEWKKYNVPINIDFEVINQSSSSVVNGVMHWMLSEHGLIAYDPRKRPDQVRFIALPGEQKVNRFLHICAAYQGQLRYFKVSGLSENSNAFQSFNIWVLSDYSSGDWFLQHRVNYVDIQFSNALSGQNLFLILPIAFHPYDPDIVYLGYGREIISYNVKTRILDFPEDFTQVRGKETFGYLETHLLVIPPWPVSFPRTELQRISS